MRILKFLIFGVLVFQTNIFAEPADEGLLSKFNIEASGTTDVYSKYIWRGFALDTDPSLQPGFNLSGYNVTFSFWSSWDLDNSDNSDGDEIDCVIDYSYDFDYVSVLVGHTYYEFHGTDTFSREFYGGIEFTTLPLAPTFIYYYDYGDEEQGGADGRYMTAELSHSTSLIESSDITLDLRGRIGYNKELFIEGEGGDVLLSAGLSILLAKGLNFSPSINYAMPYGDLNDSSDGNQRDRFYYGFSLAYTF